MAATCFSTSIQVRFCDIDGLGHINNAVYLSYFESARAAWFKHIACDEIFSPSGKVNFLIARAEIDFLAEGMFQPVLDIRVKLTHIGNKSFRHEYECVDNQGNQLAKSVAILVWFDHKMKKSTPIPDAIRKVFEQYLDKQLT